MAIFAILVYSPFSPLPDLLPNNLCPHFIWMTIWKEIDNEIQLCGSNPSATIC